MRWATSIEKVLTMRKMPTRRAIPAKPSIAYFIGVRNPSTSLRPSSADSAWVSSLYSPPTAAEMFFFTCSWLNPGAAVTSTFVNTPSLPRS